MDQEQKEEERAVGRETSTDLRVVACPVDEQEARREVESEREVVGASSAVPSDFAHLLVVAEGEEERSDHVHPHVGSQVQEGTQFWEKEHWGRETL